MHKAWFLGLMLVACGGGDDNGRHPAAPDTGGSSTTGGKAHAGSGSSADSGVGGDTAEPEGGAGAIAAEGGAGGEEGIIYEMAGAPAQPEPGACDPEMMPGEDEAESVGSSGSKLLAMSLDELSVAYLTGNTLSVADRSAANAAFAEQVVTLPSGYEAVSGVALSGDGLVLTVVRDDQSGFADLSRAARNQAFGDEADETRFALINDLKETTGRSVGWPVISNDGKSLYYVSHFGYALVVQSSLSNGAFDYGKEIDEFTLGGKENEYKLLSGISVDERAIFFFDQATGHAMALFRSRDGAPFYNPLDLGERAGVVPNLGCTRLYSAIASGLASQATQ